ncbi:hypothetical protein ACHAXN_005399 [Cyclotella atomus]
MADGPMNELIRGLRRGNTNSSLSVLLILALLVLPSAALPENPTSESKRVDEEEEEIGYIQTLLLNTPAVATVNSTYQKIEVYESDHFGKVFLLDDCLQLTERDAPHYNEMLAHVPVMEYLASNVEIDEQLDILVVGGGDGYVVSELLKYPNVGSIDHVDLDGDVISVSKNHFPWAKSVWDNEKVNLVVGDGAQFVKEQVEKKKNYHVIIQDASDPFWIRYDGSVVILPSHVLYEEEHFQRMHKLLEAKHGVLMYQAETYNIPSNLKEIAKWRKLLKSIGFGRARYGSIAISTYPTGQIGFIVSHAGVYDDNVCSSSDEAAAATLCSEIDNPEISLDWMDWNNVAKTFNALESTKYYHPRIHRSSFDLPLWVEKTIYNAANDMPDE